MTERHYLDHNATSPMRPEVTAAVRDALERVGNPSSVHHEGRAARAAIESARDRVAALVESRAAEVLFTSGGTEANNQALRPGALTNAEGRPATRLLIAATEHPSVIAGHGFGADRVSILPVDPDGRLDLAALQGSLDASDETALVAVQLANSETGVLQRIPEIAHLVRRRGGVVHCDVVQAGGRVPVSLATIGVHSLAISAHKLGGPMGVGALVVADGHAGEALAQARGGGQERGRRAGTENVAGIVGFGVAASLAANALETERPRLLALRGAVEQALRALAPDVVLFGAAAERLPNTVAFAVPGLSAATALMAFDLDGIAVSSGSACSSGKVGRSHVLAAMAVPPALAAGAVRLSLGWNSAQGDVLRFAQSCETLLQRLYRLHHARAA